ncbi:MAG: pilus assembly protein TadG-related protein [Bacillota bacterium]
MNGWKIARSRRGAAALLVVIWLPVLLAVTSLAVNLGRMLVDRSRLQAAADLAALAAVQSVDWDALAEGEILLVPQLADMVAREYSRQNLEHLMARKAAETRVWVVNGSVDDPAPHPVTGVDLKYPTVVVRLSIERPSPVLGAAFGSFTLCTEADASVRPRE